MSKANNIVFQGLRIVAWIIFIGLSIEAGGMIVNFIFHFYKPEIIHNLYNKLDLSRLYESDAWAFYGMYSFILAIALLKTFLFYTVVVLVRKIDLSKPFSNCVSKKISLISYFTLSIGLLSYVARQAAINLTHKGLAVENLTQFWGDSEAWILMAAVIYVIATIFRKGIEMQNEIDFTV